MATKVDFSKLKKDIKKVREEIAREYQRIAPDLILGQISIGFSPVKGEGKFQSYSDSYKKSIKTGSLSFLGKLPRPVNLFLSGQLHNSFFTNRVGNSVIIGFKDPLADIHTNQGAGASGVIRKMLPQSGDRFNIFITTRLKEVAVKVVQKFLK
jgi:hypothetical protein